MSLHSSPFDPKVTLTYPNNLEKGVDNESEIEIQVTMDLDKNFINQFVYVYNEAGNKVPGTTSYKDKKITFKPTSDFQAGDTIRVVIIGDDLSGKNLGIRNVLGNRMKGNYQFSFTIKSSASVHPPVLISPQNQELIKTVPNFKWEPKAGEESSISHYQIQLSNSNIISNVVWPADWETYETEIDADGLIPSVSLADGIYYWRMRSVSTTGIKSNWSPIYTFNIDRKVYGATAPEDPAAPDGPFFDYFDGSDFEVLEVFPEDNFSGVATNLKQIGIKIKGVMSGAQINYFISSFKITGSYVDETTYEPELIHSSVGIVNDGNPANPDNPKSSTDDVEKTTTIIVTLKPLS